MVFLKAILRFTVFFCSFHYSDIGVVGGCGELCSIVANKFANGNQVVDTVCSLLCDIVGIKEFIKIIQE